MQEAEVRPLYTFFPKSRRNNGLIFSLLVLVGGLVLGVSSGDLPNLMMGVGLIGASYSWFSVATRFFLYQNVLVIKYGWPKTRVIPYDEISLMENVYHPQGEQLRLRMTNGKQVMITADDVDLFRASLEEARRGFQGGVVEPIPVDLGQSGGQRNPGRRRDDGRDRGAQDPPESQGPAPY